MPDSLDVYRSANLLIVEHGETAVLEAAMRADEMLAKGDLNGRAVWLQVLAAVKKLQDVEPVGKLH